MVDILLELDDDLIKQYELKALLKGRTLEEELRATIEAAGRALASDGSAAPDPAADR